MKVFLDGEPVGLVKLCSDGVGSRVLLEVELKVVERLLLLLERVSEKVHRVIELCEMTL